MTYFPFAFQQLISKIFVSGRTAIKSDAGPSADKEEGGGPIDGSVTDGISILDV